MPSSRSKTCPRRGGFSLVEVVGVVFGVGLLLSLSAVVMNQALWTQTRAVVHLNSMQNLNMAAEKFRQDVNLSSRRSLDGIIELELLDGSICRYAIQDGALVREMQVAGGDDESQFSRQQWTLPAGATMTWSEDSSGLLPLVACRLEFDNSAEAHATAPDARAFEPMTWLARAGGDPQ